MHPDKIGISMAATIIPTVKVQKPTHILKSKTIDKIAIVMHPIAVNFPATFEYLWLEPIVQKNKKSRMMRNSIPFPVNTIELFKEIWHLRRLSLLALLVVHTWVLKSQRHSAATLQLSEEANDVFQNPPLGLFSPGE